MLPDMELVEGKDRPKELGPEMFSQHGKTGSLLLRLCQGIFKTGKAMILDSGFCVSQAVADLMQCGAYSSALAKKRRYWPKHTDGSATLFSR